MFGYRAGTADTQVRKSDVASDDESVRNHDLRLSHLDDGLDRRGRIRREGQLSRIDPVFLPLVSTTEAALRDLLGRRLHSVYLYGSVPRGTAVPGKSDLDVSVVLHDPPTNTDRISVGRLATELDRRTDLVDEVGITLDAKRWLLSPAQRHDGAFHITCLCTPLWGPDLAEQLPEQYPTIDLARDITSGSAAAFSRLAATLSDPATTRPDYARQRVGRRIARLAFACVLFRWPGWTSDPAALVEVVKAYYPHRAAELDRSIELGWGRLYNRPPTAPEDQQDANSLLQASAPWWLAEHLRATTINL